MITKLKSYKESILIPRNLEGRQEKLRQENIKLLSQETIDDHFKLEKYMLNIPQNLIKVKTINGDLICGNLSLTKLPEWFKNLIINGNFYCGWNKLTTLENCPQNIRGGFFCTANILESLKGCPEIINGPFECQYNKLASLEYGPKFVNGNYKCYNNKVILEKPIDCKIYGTFSY